MPNSERPIIVQGGDAPVPAFVPTDPGLAIGEFALQLVTEGNGVWHSMGTAVLIGECLALTARHILQACERAYGFEARTSAESHGEFNMFAFQFVGAEARQWRVVKVHANGSSDVALLVLSSNPQWVPQVFPRINLTPPRVGSRVAAFGYAGSAALEGNVVTINPGPSTSVGEVIEVFPGGRDRVCAPFPCFHVNSRYDDSMSGGPVFDDYGALCGIICASIPPNAEGEQHASLVALLWPIVGNVVDAPWEGRPRDSLYSMRDFLLSRGAGVLGLDLVCLGEDGLSLTLPHAER